MGNKSSANRPPEAEVTSAEPARDGGQVEAAHYIRDAVIELSQLAQRHRLGMLVYLLDMARLEASEAIRLKGQPK